MGEALGAEGGSQRWSHTHQGKESPRLRAETHFGVQAREGNR
jgi:hypothetical protein